MKVAGFLFIIIFMIYRSKIDDIIFEFSPAENESRGVVIICDGFPSVPRQKELLSYLSAAGYFIIFPRYRGTWESDGEFLKESPAKDIEDVINFIKNNKIKELYVGKEFDIRDKNIHLLGSSFGGSVALSLVESDDVNKIIALSPVVDFKMHNKDGNEQDLLWVRDFIKQAFDQGYRFKDECWNKMVSGDIFNPKQKLNEKEAEKISIIYDQSDKEIDYKKIENYASQNNIKTIKWDNVGHISFSKLSKDKLDEIIGIIRS